MLRTLLILLGGICCGAARGQDSLTIHTGTMHLGDPEKPEWEWFEKGKAHAGPWEVRFQGQANAAESTLFIRQADVKLEWRVHLNGRRVGNLFLMEEELVHAIAVPVGALRDGENVLTLIPPVTDPTDDILLREIVLDPRPLRQAIGSCALEVEVWENVLRRIPARVTVVDEKGALAAMIPEAGQKIALRPGVAYTGNGRARLRLRPGRYTVYASRGFEYGVASEKIELKAGGTESLQLSIDREVDTAGWVACDTHVHTRELSGHGDATVDERMWTIAGEGIELPVATEHNQHADYAEGARRTGMDRYFTTVRGNEVTTSVGHFNIFPVDAGAKVPDFKLTSWPHLMDAMRATPGVKMIVLNHPRSTHSKFRPFAPENYDTATGENRAGLDFRFHGIEALNSGAQQTDYLLVFRDWFALLNRGHRITAVGASDSHDVSRFVVGQARTYIAAPDEDPAKIDIAAACENLAQGRAVVSMGLFPTISVEAKYGVGDVATGLPEKIRVRVQVAGPSWVRAERVQLFANGVKIQEGTFDEGRAFRPGEKKGITWIFPKPAKDVHLVAIATGPAVTEPFWAMSRPYQPMSPNWTGRAIGVTNPVWLDCDGDGRFAAIEAKRKDDGARVTRDELLAYTGPDGNAKRVKDLGDWTKRRGEILHAASEIMGSLPGAEKHCPLEVRVEEEVNCGNFVRRAITYASEPGSRVPAYLLIPKTALAGEQRLPAVLCLHPTDDKVGHGVVVGLGGKENRQYAVELAERGFVAIAPAYPHLAKYRPDLAKLGYVSGTMKAIHDNRRALDLLDALPFVRAGNYAAIGHSLGGHNSVYTAVFDERIKVVVSSCGLDSYRDYKGGDIRGWTSSRYMPRLLQWRERMADIPVDFAELIGAIAPRRVLISAPTRDDNFRADSVDRVAAAARPVFELHGVGGHLVVEHPDATHDFPDAIREKAYRLIEQVLEK